MLTTAGFHQAVKATPLVVFMKGTPDLPQCGFSRAVCQILEVQGVKPDKMQAYNCLEDPELREGIKEFRCVETSLFSLAHSELTVLVLLPALAPGPLYHNSTWTESLLVDATLSSPCTSRESCRSSLPRPASSMRP